MLVMQMNFSMMAQLRHSHSTGVASWFRTLDHASKLGRRFSSLLAGTRLAGNLDRSKKPSTSQISFGIFLDHTTHYTLDLDLLEQHLSMVSISTSSLVMARTSTSWLQN
jgi:hypothetical protein